MGLCQTNWGNQKALLSQTGSQKYTFHVFFVPPKVPKPCIAMSVAILQAWAITPMKEETIVTYRCNPSSAKADVVLCYSA